ncbi:Rha family transcriptional regulator [Salmonella enterica subsp. enterica]|nr:Rha family transcriptional regulator [Salmonella enterica subsp. enterica serovar Teko]EDV4441925.1 Rha family transcriptional regulator [Salmonella enterica subsp. enterica serovar Teko]
MNKLNALTGQGLTQPEIGQAAISAPTMSSLEMVDYINANRKAKAEAEGLSFPCKKCSKLSHKNFMPKVLRVLGEIQSAKFLADYIDDKGRTQPCYNFPKREACLMAMSYDYELQAQIFDYMTELERNINGDLVYTIQQMENIVSIARKASDEDSSDAGRRLRQRQDDLPLLDKAEKLVKDFRQFSFELIGGGKVEVSV